ncbi:hypothetical protein [Paenibacillus glycinis]|uniref:Uncharacterized protein n=1 Tax=Paenibacillus glycinis TaxID=2697035 RepID=A0ABW9XQA6_9BACL|nr:hypothetical protein [Paenibacillus glycinis]NBD24805.1 hypothetical protein [Paenibacillus glycinis]
MYGTMELHHDVDFENAIFFGQYVMVLKDEKVSGGGLLESFDEKHVWINGKRHSRLQSSFIQMPPPDVHYDIPS